MRPQRKIAIVLLTLFLGGATGHVVQTGGLGSFDLGSVVGGAGRGAAADVTPVAARTDLPVGPLAALPDFPAAPALPARAVDMAARRPAIESPMPPAGTVCGVDLSATAAPAAMIAIALDAPCRPGERVTLRHAGLMVTGTTDGDGRMRMTLPALERDAGITVTLSDGTRAVARADVPDAAAWDRVAVQWQGRDSFSLHAREFGAAPGGAGHVFSGASHGPGRGLRGEGGFLTRLGSTEAPLPMLAEVYSFPAGMMARPGAVRLEIEAPVTAQTCGRDMLAETLVKRGDNAPVRTDLSVSVPGCDADGQVLVLRNLLPDLRVAAN